MHRPLIALAGLLLATQAYAQPPAPVGGDMSNTTTKATNSITSRKLSDRAADVCNIQDQLAADGDAAAAFMRCLTTAKPVIWFPAGPYVIKSMTTPVGIFLAPVAFAMDHISDRHIEATGATFTMANGITPGSWHIFMAYKDSKNISWRGGTFQLNPGATSGAPGLVNAFCWGSTTNLQISEVVLYANGAQASAFCGAWGFDNRVANNWAYGFTFGFDLAYEEDLLAEGNFFDAKGSPLPAQNFSISSVPANYTQNMSTWPDGTTIRPLRNGQANGLKVVRNTFASSSTGVRLQDVNGALVDGNVITGTIPAQTSGNNTGILINTDANTNAEGNITKGVIVTNNTITGVGNSVTPGTSGGVLLADGGFGLANINIIGNAIYDNCGKGIGPNGIGATTGVSILSNDFRTRGGPCVQSASVDTAMIASLGYNKLQSGGNSDTTSNYPVVDVIAGTTTVAGGHPRMAFRPTNVVLYSSDASGADRVAFIIQLDSNTSAIQYRVPMRSESPLSVGGGTTGGAGALTITAGATATDPIVYQPAGTGGQQFGGKVIMPGLPSSCTGQPTGALWKNAAAINICP